MNRMTRTAGLTAGLVLALAAGLEASVVHVKTSGLDTNDGRSWSRAVRTLERAVDLARADGGVTEIWIAHGIYLPVSAVRLVDSVDILGGFQDGEVDRERRDPDRYPVVIAGPGSFDSMLVGSNLTRGVTIDGVDMRAGQNRSSSPGGFITMKSGNLELTRCTIYNNESGNFSGGPRGSALTVTGGAVTVRGCAFIANWAGNGLQQGGSSSNGSDGGAVYLSSGVTRFSFCTFNYNTAGSSPDATSGRGGRGGHGGAVYVDAGDHRFANCTFLQNRGGEGGSGAPTREGAGGSGGAVYVGGPVEYLSFHNCVFDANAAGTGGADEQNPPGGPGGEGGALAIGVPEARNVLVVNSTLVRNSAGGVGAGDPIPGRVGGIAWGPAGVVVANAILWDNRSGDGRTDEAAQLDGTPGLCQLVTSNVQGLTGGLGGVGNIGDVPGFADPSQRDYRLTRSSPGIDAGANLAIGTDPLDLDNDGDLFEPLPIDLDGQPRQRDQVDVPDRGFGSAPIVDMGAYEYFVLCTADFNVDGRVDSDDFFDFLNAFNTGSGSADFNHDGTVDSDDFFDYLNAYAAGC